MSTIEDRSREMIESVTPVIGLEVHVELATRTKLFTRVGSPACAAFESAAPNELVDPVVLALPGALPVINRRAVELSVRVGLALGCSIAERTKWDRKSYFYPDLPKAYQISQYDMPLCFDGETRWPIAEVGDDGAAGVRPIRIERAHLEEDAGKLMHEAPTDMPELKGTLGRRASIVDLNRAGTPLLEIVTAPDFRSIDELVAFSQHLQRVVRWLGVSEADMQKGHMRFEPNVNCVLHLVGGRQVETPITEIKNLNSFRGVRAAVERELSVQPGRWVDDGLERGPGTKSTWGWDETQNSLFLMRAKEDAHDYRYFPDPDLPPISVPRALVDDIAAELRAAGLPHERATRYQSEFGLDARTASALTESRGESDLFEASVEAMLHEAGRDGAGGLAREIAGKAAANVLLQGMRAVANERLSSVTALGLSAEQVAGVAVLRASDAIDSNAVVPLVNALLDEGGEAHAAAERMKLLKVTDDEALEHWVDEVLADPSNEKTVADVRGGKRAAVGRLIGGVMQRSGGQADAKRVRELILARLS